MSALTVGELARMAGISVRTLHHYDEIGLLRPSGRSESGYRLYAEDDVARLRRILFYRELDFGLEAIGELLDDPAAGADGQLRRQHRLLRERLERTRALLSALEHEMEARDMGISLTPEEQLEIFGTDRLEELAEEAGERWGETEAWRESRRRTASYGKAQWLEIRREADASIEAFADALRTGEPADGPVAMHLAETHRLHVDRWFYACDHAQHRRLGELYVSDPRYVASYDEIAPGFARYVHDAIAANAARAADGA